MPGKHRSLFALPVEFRLGRFAGFESVGSIQFLNAAIVFVMLGQRSSDSVSSLLY
jgi:hypothetical protein